MFRAQLDVAKDLLRKPYRVIDFISIRIAPEVAEHNLPAQRIVFAACPVAFDSWGTRRTHTPPLSGVHKPNQYWDALYPSRVRYYNNADCQSRVIGAGRILCAEAGEAVKRLRIPILIAIRIGGHLRCFHLFSQYVDYLCYYDLRVWEHYAPNQHQYPAPLQA